MLLETPSHLVGSRGLQSNGMMKDFPSCFGENGVQVADSSPSTTTTTRAQNLVSCIYHHHSHSFSGFITVTWIKNLMAQALSIAVESSASDSLGRVDIRPWLFSKRKGSKKMVVDSTKVDIYWDLSSAKFGSSPEPLEGFYLAIALNQELSLLLGDLKSEAYNKIDHHPSPFASKTSFLARKEHIFGKRLYHSKAQFCAKGCLHDIRIEFDPNERFGKCLTVFVDRKAVLQVTHLQWKFRGNQAIFVDGVCVEVFWDVHGWLFDSVAGSAIFLFRTQAQPGAPSSEDWQRWKDTPSHSLGFSLVLCAWKSE
ncbi:uncharacterized protein LOC121802146 isoform X1 [Salvia splendens]|uniref:uncharacterized protein LOC121802146 isoform X1 n=1 Tax=Salvia splendens TaxID=180675 RepID=UPI001C263045|nr:uncharacterized protein LOC121802146 isoform X1 [Salvia splendens]